MYREKAELIYYTFASGIEDKVERNEFPTGTAKIVKLNTNLLYGFIIGLCKKYNKKYLYYGDLPTTYLVPSDKKDRFVDDSIRKYYLSMYIEHYLNFSSDTRKMEVLGECGNIMKKHVYKIYGKNEEIGYSNIMALVDYVCNWSPSYL